MVRVNSFEDAVLKKYGYTSSGTKGHDAKKSNIFFYMHNSIEDMDHFISLMTHYGTNGDYVLFDKSVLQQKDYETDLVGRLKSVFKSQELSSALVYTALSSDFESKIIQLNRTCRKGIHIPISLDKTDISIFMAQYYELDRKYFVNSYHHQSLSFD